jgi:hypothetical protein
MSRYPHHFVICSSIIALMAASSASALLCTGGLPGSDLYDLDSATWTLSNRRPVRLAISGTLRYAGLDYDPTGVLWILRDDPQPLPRVPNGLYRLDPQNGAAVLAAQTSYCNAFDIDFDPVTGALYALRTDATGNAVLARFETATGSRTDLTVLGDANARWALMLDGAGQPYAMNGTPGELLHLDKYTGTLLSTITAAVPYVDHVNPPGQFDFYSLYRLEMEYDPIATTSYVFGFWNNLYRDQSVAMVYSLDPPSGSVVELSSTALGVDAVTAIPEPATLLLLSLVGVEVMRRTRR